MVPLRLAPLVLSLLTPRAAPGPTRAQDAGEKPIETRVRSAALFKNGVAFLRREGEIPPGCRSIVVDRLPIPTHGTFWLAADPAKATLGAALARKTEIRERAPAAHLGEFLRANLGREVTLQLADKESLRGLLLSAPEPSPRPPLDRERSAYVIPTSPESLVLLKTLSGTAAIAVSEVRRALIEGAEPARDVEWKREGAILTCGLEPKSDAPAPLSILYLERGLTWAPSYAIDLSDKEKAVLTAKAEVLNEAEDLEGATLQFVTGFPNLKFAHVTDPIAMRGDLNSFLSALAGQGAADARNVMAQSVMANVAWRAEADASAFPLAPPPLPGETAEDLFLYERKGVTLKRSERGLYPLFTLRVPYEHLYEWSIPDTIGEQPNYGQPQPPREEEVWHSVRLTNDSGIPWTTAPAMTMKDGNLLGQDTLSYAAAGARTTVRITRAVDVQGEQAEYEVSRDRGAGHFYGTSYDRVTVKGEIRATNHKREPVRLEITKSLQGEVTKNPGEAKVVQVAKGLRQVNPNARLTWTVPLEPGKMALIVYEYALYVRP